MTDPATVVELWPYEGCLWHGVRTGFDDIQEEGVLWGRPVQNAILDILTGRTLMAGRWTNLALAPAISEPYALQAMIRVPGEVLDFDRLLKIDGAPWFAYGEPIPLHLCQVECR